eukprot:gnl/Dysnectes_brevis/5426_a7792_491.p1 GENE.gnl/Dysnectes_brevis/5426_a7792_491~~gnl/Dysnectes_brevis/5426_a7792_491.p1  ORF type:complete len:215 (+),score=18.90 gnl/Dysnectes_brevis/5426_a7792_491:122-766(+)
MSSRSKIIKRLAQAVKDVNRPFSVEEMSIKLDVEQKTIDSILSQLTESNMFGTHTIKLTGSKERLVLFYHKIPMLGTDEYRSQRRVQRILNEIEDRRGIIAPEGIQQQLSELEVEVQQLKHKEIQKNKDKQQPPAPTDLEMTTATPSIDPVKLDLRKQQVQEIKDSIDEWRDVTVQLLDRCGTELESDPMTVFQGCGLTEENLQVMGMAEYLPQ